MKQKLSLVCALVAQPQILLLDEPTTGVDPVSRREFWDTLAHLAADGLTILVATPYLDEAERCHRVSLIHQGEIRDTGTPKELRAALRACRLEVYSPELGKAENALLAASGQDDGVLMDVQRFGDRLDVIAKRCGAGDCCGPQDDNGGGRHRMRYSARGRADSGEHLRCDAAGDWTVRLMIAAVSGR